MKARRHEGVSAVVSETSPMLTNSKSVPARPWSLPPCLRAFVPSCLLLFACPALAQEKTTYQDHVLPVFRNTCLNCHNPEKKKAGLDLSSYATAMAGSENGKVIEPGDPDGSLLFRLVQRTEEPFMPP